MAVTTLKLTSKEPNQRVIWALLRTLKRAKAGELDGIIILGIGSNGNRLRVTAGDMGEANACFLLQVQLHVVMQSAVEGESFTYSDVKPPTDPDDDGDEGSE